MSPLTAWINKSYLNENTQQQVRAHFESVSSIELKDFLLLEKYTQLEKELK